MSVGIKIRALDNTTFIGSSDVFIVDTPNPIDTGLSYTKNVKYSDLISQLNTDLEIPDSGGEVSDILLLTQGETIVLKVTVGPKTIYNRHYTESPDVCYYINGEESPAIIMSPDRTYRFDLSEVPDSYDFFLYNDRDSSFFAVPEVTFGENFLEYKAINRYERVYYSGVVREVILCLLSVIMISSPSLSIVTMRRGITTPRGSVVTRHFVTSTSRVIHCHG